LKKNQAVAVPERMLAENRIVAKTRKFVFLSMNGIGILRSSVGGGIGDSENRHGLWTG
jgi:hypothetical protein